MSTTLIKFVMVGFGVQHSQTDNSGFIIFFIFSHLDLWMCVKHVLSHPRCLNIPNGHITGIREQASSHSLVHIPSSILIWVYDSFCLSYKWAYYIYNSTLHANTSYSCCAQTHSVKCKAQLSSFERNLSATILQPFCNLSATILQPFCNHSRTRIVYI